MLGFIEYAVFNNFGILFECCIGVNVCQVRIQSNAAHGEGIGVDFKAVVQNRAAAFAFQIEVGMAGHIQHRM